MYIIMLLKQFSSIEDYEKYVLILYVKYIHSFLIEKNDLAQIKNTFLIASIY
jgi:hypothetical protein